MAVTWNKPAIAKTNKSVGDFNQAHRFTVEVDGVVVGGIMQVDGIEHENEVIEAHDGDNLVTSLQPGRIKQSTVKLTRHFTGDKSFMQWRQTTIDGKPQRKSVSIVMLTADGQETMRYNFTECWCSKYYGPQLNSLNSAAATEAIDFRWEQFTMA